MNGTSNEFPNININERSSLSQSKRKFSFPASLHSTSLLDVTPTVSARRRLSNVSDAVTRKLSAIGWKPPQIPAQEIITQGKCLCGQYIRRRLKRSGLFNRKLGLQRIRSIIDTTSSTSTIVIKEVFPALTILGDELERLHPRVYVGVTRQISRSSEISTDTVSVLLSTIARDLFRNDITWGKVVSLFAIAGGLAVDCVRQGHPDYLPRLVESITEVIEDELVPWISDNGGWIGLINHVCPESQVMNALEWTTLFVGIITFFVVVIIILRFIGIFFVPIFYAKT